MFKNFFSKLFSLKGRYSKLEYLIYGILIPFGIIIIGGILAAILGLKGSSQLIVMILSVVIAFVFAIIAVVKRVRAINGNIFFNLLMFILFLPFYIIYLFSVTTVSPEKEIKRDIKQDFFDFVKFIIPILIFMAIGYYNKYGANFKNPFASKNSIEKKCEDKQMYRVLKEIIAKKIVKDEAAKEFISKMDIYNSKKIAYDPKAKIVDCTAVLEVEGVKTDFHYAIQEQEKTKEGLRREYISIDKDSINRIYNNIMSASLQKPSCSSEDVLNTVKQLINQGFENNPLLKEMAKNTKFKFEKVTDINSARAVNYNETTNLVECKANIKTNNSEIAIAYTVQIPPEEPDKYYVEISKESMQSIYQNMLIGNFLNLNKEH